MKKSIVIISLVAVALLAAGCRSVENASTKPDFSHARIGSVTYNTTVTVTGDQKSAQSKEFPFDIAREATITPSAK